MERYIGGVIWAREGALQVSSLQITQNQIHIEVKRVYGLPFMLIRVYGLPYLGNRYKLQNFIFECSNIIQNLWILLRDFDTNQEVKEAHEKPKVLKVYFKSRVMRWQVNYIYIYIERERERERRNAISGGIFLYKVFDYFHFQGLGSLSQLGVRALLYSFLFLNIYYSNCSTLQDKELFSINWCSH